MKKRRLIIVGCGAASREWLAAINQCFSDHLELVGLVDIKKENAQARAAEYGYEKVWTGTSLECALAELKPDVVFDCTIPDAHAPTCKAALKAGCDVLVEKPLASSIADARELVALSHETGKTLAVIQNRRYHSGIQTAKRTLSEGTIGRVHTLCADFFLAPRFGGFRDRMKHPLLLDMAIHTFDQARYLSGLDAVKVHCHEFNPSGSWYSHGASAIATFQMTGGAVFSYRGSWAAQGCQTTWFAAWRIIGERGTLLWNGGDEDLVVEKVVGEHNGSDFFQPISRVNIPVTPISNVAKDRAGNIGEFLEALDSGAAPQTVAFDNIQSLAMLEGAIISSETESTVSLDSILKGPHQ